MSPQFKIPYEPPRIVSLSAEDAHAAYSCKAGYSFAAPCTSGGSPGKACQNGSTAYGGPCTTGTLASGYCTRGLSPKK